MTNNNERCDLKAAADYVGLSVATMRNYRAQSKGPQSFRIGGKVMYSRAGLDSWIASEMAGSTRGGVL